MALRSSRQDFREFPSQYLSRRTLGQIVHDIDAVGTFEMAQFTNCMHGV